LKRLVCVGFVFTLQPYGSTIVVANAIALAALAAAAAATTTTVSTIAAATIQTLQVYFHVRTQLCIIIVNIERT
jgi:hypothetical protein